MRAAAAWAIVLGSALGLGLGAGGGCTLGDQVPDRSCKSDGDCFRAQGEFCNRTTSRCELRPDAGTALQLDDEEAAP